MSAHLERSRRPCKAGPVTPQDVRAELRLVVGRGACGGGGVSTVLLGPPFLQREKRLVRGDLISNSRRR